MVKKICLTRFLFGPRKDRIGLIGTNGTGKTSLLNIIAGIDSSDGDRQTVFYPTDYRIGYLSQAAEFSDELTVLQAVFQGNSPLIQTVRAYEEALIELGKTEKTLMCKNVMLKQKNK